MAPVYARWSTQSQLLGYLEQSPLFNAINFNLPPDVPNLDTMMMGFMPGFTSPNGANSTVSRLCPATMLCPSDAASTGDWPGACSYSANEGSWLCDACEQTPSTVAPGQLPQGPFYNRSCVRMAGFIDGTSQTAFFSERRRGNGNPDPRSDLFQMPNATSLTHDLPDLHGPDTLDGDAADQPRRRGLGRRRHDLHDLQPRLRAEHPVLRRDGLDDA